MNEIEKIAKICHEANKAYSESIGDNSHLHWDETPIELKKSVIEGVKNAINGSTPEKSHESWLKFKIANGWTWGMNKSLEFKTHPLLVPYSELSHQDKIKDTLFVSIVNAMLSKQDDFDMKNPLDYTKEDDIFLDKSLRIRLKKVIELLMKSNRSRERSLTLTKVEEASMWLGKDLGRLNELNPYPDGYKMNDKINKEKI